jgi:ABC-type Fe3+/spermidine/putrescine transport system ATPase subunit
MLKIIDVSKEFDGKKVLDSLTITVNKGERVAILGPSGSGKSTLLNCICGIVIPDEGSILWNEEDIMNVPTFERNFGLMFQEYALFPHMTVEENISFGLEMIGIEKFERALKVKQMLELIGLSGFEKRSVQQLSGGEQQRVALARSLAPAPRLLLLDEPLGALDRTLRENLMIELQTILKDQTVILVTHDQGEAFQIADKVYIMNHGKVVQNGTPLELLETPNSVFVAEFLGYENIYEGIFVASENVIRTKIGDLKNEFSGNQKDGEKVSLLLKSHHLALTAPKNQNDDLYIGEGEIITIDFNGKMMRLKIAIKDDFVIVEEPLAMNPYEIGNMVSIWMLDRKAMVIFDGKDESY